VAADEGVLHDGDGSTEGVLRVGGVVELVEGERGGLDGFCLADLFENERMGLEAGDDHADLLELLDELGVVVLGKGDGHLVSRHDSLSLNGWSLNN